MTAALFPADGDRERQDRSGSLVFTLAALTVIDRFGRRPLLIGGMTFVVLTLALRAGDAREDAGRN